MQALGIERALLVCDDRMASSFPLKVTAHFCAFHPNPDLADCLAGAELYRRMGCDGLISMGGGSSMDTAKGIKTMLCTEGMDQARRSLLAQGGRVKHIAIPTTAGTGSEATAVAVTYENGQKLSLNHPSLLPDAAVLDSSLLDSLPPYHKKACALDALCQGVESYWAARATDESREHALRAVRGVLGNISAYLAGDAAAADAMQLAAWESGRAIRMTATTAAHAMSYQITKRLGVAHGQACAFTLPILWERLEKEENSAVLALAGELGLAGGEGPALVRGLMAATGMLPEGPVEDALLDYLADTVNVERLSNHPQRLDRDELRAVYAQAFAPMGEEALAACTEVWHRYEG